MGVASVREDRRNFFYVFVWSFQLFYYIKTNNRKRSTAYSCVHFSLTLFKEKIPHFVWPPQIKALSLHRF